MTGLSIETIVAITVPLIALCFTALTFRRNERHDTSAEATERATMTADIRYIRSSIDDIKIDNKAIQKAVESYRITPEQKEYLKTLKIKAKKGDDRK